MKYLALAAFLLPATAFAQATDPETASAETLDCEATPGGAECKIETVDEGTLYCLASDAAGDPLANSTASSDAGVAVFNAVDVAQIADITCRVE